MRVEEALELKLLDELRALGVSDGMLQNQVPCKSGRIDIVVYTQPRCLIEVKMILDEKTLSDAIKKLMRYRSSFVGARLFIAHKILRVEREVAVKQMQLRGIRPWTPGIARQIADECLATATSGETPPSRQRATPRQSTRELEFHDFLTLSTKYSYRTLRRRLAIAEAIRKLPPHEQGAATEALAQLGIGKAAILAPLLRSSPSSWRLAVEEGRSQTAKELQKVVTRTLGLKRRGLDLRNERFYRNLLDTIPLDKRNEIAAVFDAVFRLMGSTDPVKAFIRIVEEAKTAFIPEIRGEHTKIP